MPRRRPALAPRPARRWRRLLAPALGVGLLAGCGSGRLATTNLQNSVADSVDAQIGLVLIRHAYIRVPDGLAYPQGADAPAFVTLFNEGNADDALLSVSTPAARRVVFRRDPTYGIGPVPSGALPTPTPTPSFVDPTFVLESTPSASPIPSIGGALPNLTPSAGASEPLIRVPPPPSGAAEILPRVPIPARGRSDFAVGGFYLDLQGLTQPLATATSVPMTFTFARAGSITLRVIVQTPASPLPRPTPSPTGG